MIRHQCPDCGGKLEHSPEAAGMDVICRYCRSLVEVPEQGTVAAVTPPEGKDAGPSRPVIDRIGEFIDAHTADTAPAPWGVGWRILYGFLGLFFATVSGGVFAYAVWSFILCLASQNWPSVPGKVLHAGLSEKTGRTAQGHRTVEHSAAVVFQYTVRDQNYTGTRLGFGPEQNYSFAARALAERYRKGQEVTVWYDPADPKKAVLQRTVLFGAYVFALVGLFVGYVGLRLLLVGLMPVLSSSNSRWLPWSRRFTWPDLPLLLLGSVGLVLVVPMLFGI